MRAWLLTLLPILEGPEENFHLVGEAQERDSVLSTLFLKLIVP